MIHPAKLIPTYLSVIVSIAVLLFLAGCKPDFPYANAEKQYAAENYVEAAGMFGKYASFNNPQRYEAMYYEGMSWLEYGDVKKAVGIFNETIRYADERRLRARAIAARARCYAMLGESEQAIGDYRSLIEMYPDVFPVQQAREGLAQVRGGGVAGSGLTLQPVGSGQLLYRVRIRPHYLRKGDALAAMGRLKNSGVEVALSREPGRAGDEFIIQVGAFASRARAKARSDSLKAAGWKTYILPVK